MTDNPVHTCTAWHYSTNRLRRDLVTLCRELGLDPDIRGGGNRHFKVYAAGRLLTTVGSTPSSPEHALTHARQDIVRALRS